MRNERSAGFGTVATLLSLTWLLAANAHAWDVNGRGKLVAEPRSFTVSFDSAASLEALGAQAFTASATPLGEDAFAALFRSDANGLEGEGALVLGGEAAGIQLVLTALRSRFEGRRVAFRLWQKPEGTVVQPYLDYRAGNAGSIGIVSLAPTGRVTDDGWEEWSSGPIDFAAARRVGPFRLFAWSGQVLQARRGPERFAQREESSTRIDAFEVVDLGPAVVPDAMCTAASAVETCGAQGVCAFGRCVDGAVRYGPVPAGDMRADYLTRRRFEMETFQGGRVPQTLMDSFSATVESLEGEAHPAAFWSTLDVAVQALRDGHASAPLRAYPPNTGVDACLHLGRADLLPGSPTLPLVFSGGGEDPVSAQLAEGDVLEAIDGLSPWDWMDGPGATLVSYPGDPEARATVAAPQLLAAAVTAGSVLRFARCTRPGGCTAGQVERFEVDLGAVLRGPAFSLDAPDWAFATTGRFCDYRFRRDVDEPGVRTSTSFVGVADVGGTRTLVINGVPAERGWQTDVIDAFSDGSATAWILDQRLGTGGNVSSLDLLMSQLVSPDDYYGFEIHPYYEGRSLGGGLRSALLDCTRVSQYGCGGSFVVPLGYYGAPAAPGRPAADVPLAVLISSDVSGNDYTTRIARFRSAPTRVFGPAPTWGAFAPIYQLPVHWSEITGGSLQQADSAFMAVEGERLRFETGRGVVPDEVIMQRQSDAIGGVDTVLEAARTWIAEVGR